MNRPLWAFVALPIFACSGGDEIAPPAEESGPRVDIAGIDPAPTQATILEPAVLPIDSSRPYFSPRIAVYRGSDDYWGSMSLTGGAGGVFAFGTSEDGGGCYDDGDFHGYLSRIGGMAQTWRLKVDAGCSRFAAVGSNEHGETAAQVFAGWQIGEFYDRSPQIDRHPLERGHNIVRFDRDGKPITSVADQCLNVHKLRPVADGIFLFGWRALDCDGSQPAPYGYRGKELVPVLGKVASDGTIHLHDLPISGAWRAYQSILDENGGLLLAGYVEGEASFGDETLVSPTAGGEAQRAAFAARFAPDGTHIHSRLLLEGALSSRVVDADPEADGTVVLTVRFEGEPLVDDQPIDAPEGRGTLVIDLAPDGSAKLRMALTYAGMPSVWDLALLPHGAIAVAGSVTEDLDLLGHVLLVPPRPVWKDPSVGYLAIFERDGSLRSFRRVGMDDDYASTPSGLVLDEDGSLVIGIDYWYRHPGAADGPSGYVQRFWP